MPRYSPVAFRAQPVEKGGELLGYVLSGFVTAKQLETLRNLIDSAEYERTKKWRGQYQELAEALVGAVDDALDATHAGRP